MPHQMENEIGKITISDGLILQIIKKTINNIASYNQINITTGCDQEGKYVFNIFIKDKINISTIEDINQIHPKLSKALEQNLNIHGATTIFKIGN